MERRHARIAISALLALGLVTGAAYASDKTTKTTKTSKTATTEATKADAMKGDMKDMAKGDAPKGDSQQDAMMQMMMKYAMPGPMHELLKPMAGNWKTTVKEWMKPGDPTVSEGMCESSWILGNRYLQSSYKGAMGGMPFEGMGLMGYDNMKKEFVSMWVDNMGTGISMSDGAADASGKMLTMKGMMPDPQSGAMVPYTMVTKIVDENTYTMSMNHMMNGADHMDMEITYTRMK